jgi:diguanylate cyclase (GGDEF)-like protein
MALHDALTGLPNRILLEDRLEQAITQSLRNNTKTAIAFVDIDNFKTNK